MKFAELTILWPFSLILTIAVVGLLQPVNPSFTAALGLLIIPGVAVCQILDCRNIRDKGVEWGKKRYLYHFATLVMPVATLVYWKYRHKRVSEQLSSSNSGAV